EVDEQLLLLTALGWRRASIGEKVVDPGGGIRDHVSQSSLEVDVAAAGAFVDGTVDGGVSQDLPQPLNPRALGAPEIIAIAVGFQQGLLDEIGPVKAHEETSILLKLPGLQQKERAIFLQIPFSGRGHGYLVIGRQRQGTGVRLMIDYALPLCK